jgi:hypothetical protein
VIPSTLSAAKGISSIADSSSTMLSDPADSVVVTSLHNQRGSLSILLKEAEDQTLILTNAIKTREQELIAHKGNLLDR